MPKIDLTFSAGALSDEARQELPRKLATAMLRWEKAPDTPYLRSISWVHLHELAEGAVYDGNGPVEPGHFAVDVTVPAGALSDRRREGLVAEFTELIVEAGKLTPADTMRVWVIIHEIPDGHWGASGAIVRFEQLRAIAARERDQTAPAG
jgi:phenylpyruvate tautomerase PptA (4-oxalocrotonate tautomerase family)